MNPSQAGRNVLPATTYNRCLYMYSPYDRYVDDGVQHRLCEGHTIQIMAA